MKIFLLFLTLCGSVLYGQQKNFLDQPYLETIAEADTLVVPDRIYLIITLSEANSKGRKSTEELEQTMKSVLTGLGIDVKKDVSLLDLQSNFKKYFLKAQDILKDKIFSVLVYDAVTAGRVLKELESGGISNVTIGDTEYSGETGLLLSLKSNAIKKAKAQAVAYTEPLGQEAGKAIYISDIEVAIANQLQGQVNGVRIRGASSYIYGNRTPEPIVVDFEKLEYKAVVKVIFLLE